MSRVDLSTHPRHDQTVSTIFPFCWAGDHPGDLGLGVDSSGTWHVLERQTSGWHAVGPLSGDQRAISLDAAMGRIKDIQQNQLARLQGRRRPLRPGLTTQQLHWPGLNLLRPAPGEVAAWPHRLASHYRLRPARDDELDTITGTRRAAPEAQAGSRNGHGALNDLLQSLLGSRGGDYLFLGINRIAIHNAQGWHVLGWSDEHGSEIQQLPRAPRRPRSKAAKQSPDPQLSESPSGPQPEPTAPLP